LVEAVPKFSKYIHGTATLNPKRIKLIPYWYPQMDVDIRKPVSHKFGIERPGASNDISTSGNLDDDSEEEDAVVGLPAANGADDDERLRALREARDVMEQNEMNRQRDYGTLTNGGDPNTLDIEERVAAGRNRDDDYPIYDSDSDDDEDYEVAKREGGLRFARKWVERTVTNVGSSILTGIIAVIPRPTPTDVGDGGFQLGVPTWKQAGEVKRFKAPKGKRESLINTSCTSSNNSLTSSQASTSPSASNQKSNSPPNAHSSPGSNSQSSSAPSQPPCSTSATPSPSQLPGRSRSSRASR
jgi:hypothetical protein